MTTPALLTVPDEAGELVFASDEHRRALARCTPGVGISFGALVAKLAADPFTFGIPPDEDGQRVSQILSDLAVGGDVKVNAHGIWEATREGWFKITNIEAGES